MKKNVKIYIFATIFSEYSLGIKIIDYIKIYSGITKVVFMTLTFSEDFNSFLDQNQIKIRIDIFEFRLDPDCGNQFRFKTRCIKFRIEIFKSGLNLDLQSGLPSLMALMFTKITIWFNAYLYNVCGFFWQKNYFLTESITEVSQSSYWSITLMGDYS